ncbi:MAG: type transport system permease protein [Candidatus Petromonas sp.]|jgi:ABC-2 type transport system permease protein|nr:type transport system permease protein [Candidatus Petromonas sp.]
MMKSISTAIKAEWDLAIKEKIIFIVIIIIPLITNLLIGYEFSKGHIDNIPMAVYDQDNSSLSRMIVKQFRENEIFDIRYYLDNSLEMKKLFDESKIRVGIIIPKDFNKDVTELKSPTLLMIYDGSHMPIAAAAKSRASEILMTLKTGISIKLLEGKLNLPPDLAKKTALAVRFSNKTLYNPTGSYKNFLNMGFGTAIVQSAIALMAASAIRSHEMKGKKKNQIGNLMGKVAFYTLMGWLSLLTSIFLQNKLFKIPFRGNLLHAVLLSLGLALSVTAFSIMISTWIREKSIATAVCAIIFVPNTIMIGYTWPVLSMPKPYQFLADFYPFYHYADNLRDLFLKGIPPIQIYGDIIWLISFSVITLFMAMLGTLRYKTAFYKKAIKKEGENIVLS